MNTLEEEQSDLFHMGKYSPLVQILDVQKGYCLLKNLCPFTDRQYSVGVLLDSGIPHMAIDDPQECWIKYDQADEVMRNALNNTSYNKATQDYFNHDENY
jgi:hypothetical protein